MYNKKGVAEVWGERRKSARISALEEKENEKRKLRAASKGKSIDDGNVQPLAPKRSRKQKRLEDIDLPYLDENQSQQDGEDTNDWNRSTRADREITGQSSMPERRFLEFALAVLQRRDTHNIFAQPVDPKEVENYDSIVKEPMDFGTMKTKLQEGKYTSLDQFESDVFLICSNAMLFNSSCTIYYKEARAMQILAQAVFSSLRNDPYKFESEFSPVRGRSGRKLPRKSEIKRTPVRTPRRTGIKIGASPLGPRDDGEPTLAKRDDPQFYRPWTSFCSEKEALVSSVYNAEKTLVIDEKFSAGYKQSLIWFARGLGPAAKREAAKKVIKCIPRAPNPSQNTQTSSRTVFCTKKCFSQCPISDSPKLTQKL